MLDKSQLSYQQAEIEKFDQLASQWWDPNGQFKQVMAFNQARLSVIQQRIYTHFASNTQTHLPLQGLSVLDIGCGAGLLCEPLAALGASVTGIDASEVSINIAKAHAKQSSLSIEYLHTLAQDLSLDRQFDIVLNTEVIEHVEDQQGLVDQCCRLLAPDGLLVMATLNRNWLSFLVAIVGAEYVLNMLPKGTHDWRYFVTPAEMQTMRQKHGITANFTAGLNYNPLLKKWRQTRAPRVNYMLFATQAG